MFGHQQIIDQRKLGRKPTLVFISDYKEEREADFGGYPQVQVAGEPIERLDLRFLVGLRVVINSPEKTRAKGLLEACRGAGAYWVSTMWHGGWRGSYFRVVTKDGFDQVEEVDNECQLPT